MSAGSFQSSKYESDDGTIHFISVQPETIAAVLDGNPNDEPAGNINSQFAAEVNRGARAYGLRPRKVNVAFTDNPPTNYRPYTTLAMAVLDPEVFAEIAIGGTVTYSGGTGVVSSKVEENVRPGKSVIVSGDEDDTPQT